MATNTKFILTLVCTSLTLFGISQSKVTVKGKHAKKLIYTLKENESFSSGEARLKIQANAVGYEFIISNNQLNKNTLYVNGKKYMDLGPWSFQFTDYSYITIPSTVDGKQMETLVLKNGKKYGPFEKLYPVTTTDLNEILGYSYQQNEQKYYFDFKQNKLFGPYESVQVYIDAKSKEYYIYYLDKGKWYIEWKNGTEGPYNALKTPHYYEETHEPYYLFQRNDGDNWSLRNDSITEFQFTKDPYVFFQNEKHIYVSGKKSDDIGYKYINGQYYPYNYYSNIITMNGDGSQVIYIEKDVAKHGETPAVFIGTTKIGNYDFEEKYPSSSPNTKFVNCIFKEKAENGLVTYYAYNNGMIKLFEKKEYEQVEVTFHNDDYYYFFKKDSILYKNGTQTGIKHVVSLFFQDTSLVVNTRMNGIDELWVNEKKISAAQFEKMKGVMSWYNLKDGPYYFTKKDEKYTVFYGKKSAPVYNRYNYFIPSKNKNHLLECSNRRQEIYLDGKLISQGFGVEYDATKNCYHWFSIKDKNLYLHTYQLD